MFSSEDLCGLLSSCETLRRHLVLLQTKEQQIVKEGKKRSKTRTTTTTKSSEERDESHSSEGEGFLFKEVKTRRITNHDEHQQPTGAEEGPLPKNNKAAAAAPTSAASIDELMNDVMASMFSSSDPSRSGDAEAICPAAATLVTNSTTTNTSGLPLTRLSAFFKEAISSPDHFWGIEDMALLWKNEVSIVATATLPPKDEGDDEKPDDDLPPIIASFVRLLLSQKSRGGSGAEDVDGEEESSLDAIGLQLLGTVDVMVKALLHVENERKARSVVVAKGAKEKQQPLLQVLSSDEQSNDDDNDTASTSLIVAAERFTQHLFFGGYFHKFLAVATLLIASGRCGGGVTALGLPKVIFSLLLHRGHRDAVVDAWTLLAASSSSVHTTTVDGLQVLIVSYLQSSSSVGTTTSITSRLHIIRRLFLALLKAISAGTTAISGESECLEKLQSTLAGCLASYKDDDYESDDDDDASASGTRSNVFMDHVVAPLLMNDGLTEHLDSRRAIQLVIDAANAADGPLSEGEDKDLKKKPHFFSSLRSKIAAKWGDAQAAKVQSREAVHIAIADALMYCLIHPRTTAKDWTTGKSGGGDTELLHNILGGVSARMGFPNTKVTQTAALIATQYSRMESEAYKASKEENSSSDEGGAKPPPIEPIVFDAFPHVVEEWIQQDPAANGHDLHRSGGTFGNFEGGPKEKPTSRKSNKSRLVKENTKEPHPDDGCCFFAAVDGAFYDDVVANIVEELQANGINVSGYGDEDDQDHLSDAAAQAGAGDNGPPAHGDKEEDVKTMGLSTIPTSGGGNGDEDEDGESGGTFKRFMYFRDAYQALTQAYNSSSGQEREHEEGIRGAVCSLPEILTRGVHLASSAKNGASLAQQQVGQQTSALTNEVNHNVAQLLRTLISLPMNCPPAVKAFVDEKRRATMALLFVTCPKAACNEASTMLYSHNYSISQRCLVLQAMAEGCRKLSAMPPSSSLIESGYQRLFLTNSGSSGKKLTPYHTDAVNPLHETSTSSSSASSNKRVYPPLPNAPSELAYQRSLGGSDANREISLRVEASTRRWGYAAQARRQAQGGHTSSNSSSTTTVNKLVDYASHFIDAIIKEHDSGHYLLLTEEDVYIGAQILQTLTAITTSLANMRHVIADVCSRIIEFEVEVVAKHRSFVVRGASWAAMYTAIEAWAGGSTAFVQEHPKWVEIITKVQLAAEMQLVGGAKRKQHTANNSTQTSEDAEMPCKRGAAAVLGLLANLREVRLESLAIDAGKPTPIRVSL